MSWWDVYDPIGYAISQYFSQQNQNQETGGTQTNTPSTTTTNPFIPENVWPQFNPPQINWTPPSWMPPSPQTTDVTSLMQPYLDASRNFINQVIQQDLGRTIGDTLGKLSSLGTTSSYTVQKALENIGREAQQRAQTMLSGAESNFANLVLQVLSRILLGY